MIRYLFKNRVILALDILAVIIARVITAIMLFPEMELEPGAYIYTGGIYIVLVVSVNLISKMYKVAWHYAGAAELIKFFIVNTCTVMLNFMTNELLAFFNIIREPVRRVNGGVAIITILIMLLIRLFSKELYKSFSTKKQASDVPDGQNKKRVIVIGAGDAARLIVSSFSNRFTSPYEVVGLIDDDKSKQGKVMYGYKVLGGRESIISTCEKMDVDSIVMAIPSAYAEDRLEILKICSQTKCRVKTLPDISELLESPEKLSVRDIRIEDLLDRDPVVLDNKGISELVKDKTVLVSGGGGSIGSELCRQIMRFSPERLIIMDIYENNAYDIQMELNVKYPGNQPVALIASIRDAKRLDEIFDFYRPDIVFHAAAHKHVPLMETSPGEAIKNNVFGTYNLAKVSDKYKVEKFVMISTDKAVNPTNIMGASKRLCEMIVQCMETVSDTEFVAVRFGNVLGSNGSVIPLFERQIAQGGPVRVTHREVTRFFMTIPEAAQLVIQAACYAKGGEIFVLDMGKPVKIYDLAENLIRLSGHTPNVDIKIEITGFRPGEKICEKLLMEQEGLEGTKHSKIFVGRPFTIEMSELEEKLSLLKNAVETADNSKIRDIMEAVVPTYIRDNEKFNLTHQKNKEHAGV